MLTVGFVLCPGFQLMALAATSVFELAGSHAGTPLYDVSLLSEHGGPVPSSMGMAMETRAYSGPVFDTLVVTGGLAPAPAGDSLPSDTALAPIVDHPSRAVPVERIESRASSSTPSSAQAPPL